MDSGFRRRETATNEVRLSYQENDGDGPAEMALHGHATRRPADVSRDAFTADAAAIWSAARAALSAFRQARTTWAPRPASTRAACRPSPVLAPVTTAVRPDRCGISASVHCR